MHSQLSREDVVMECGHTGVTVAMATEGGFPHLAPTPTLSPVNYPPGDRTACSRASSTVTSHRGPSVSPQRRLQTAWGERTGRSQRQSVCVIAAGTVRAAERRMVCVGGAQ